MAELAHLLLRTIARAFYDTEYILVIDALIFHSTLPDHDLAFVLGMQPKALRKLCGRLKEDGLISVQSRAERRTDGTQAFHGVPHSSGPQGKEKLTSRDWYYLNFHRAIDSIKYRMYKLNKHVESQGASTTEKKDLKCPRCKSQFTELEVMDKIDYTTGAFLCRRCGHPLDTVEEEERANENEMMKRLNSQLEKVLRLMQQIDATNVPENDFQTALSNHKPVSRTDANPGQQRIETVDLPNRNLQSTKGLDFKPEKVTVQVQDDVEVKKESEAAEAAARREKEARQNMLPDWIAKSTVSGDITAVGAKEEQLRKEREATSAVAKEDGGDDKKPAKNGDEDVMAAYWEELAKAQAEEAAARAKESEDEEEDDDDDEFEDVDVTGTGATTNGLLANGNGTKGIASGMTTPNVESSNATDDEREVKRVRIEEPVIASSSTLPNGYGGNGTKVEVEAEGTPAVSDEDEDELEFENV